MQFCKQNIMFSYCLTSPTIIEENNRVWTSIFKSFFFLTVPNSFVIFFLKKFFVIFLHVFGKLTLSA